MDCAVWDFVVIPLIAAVVVPPIVVPLVVFLFERYYYRDL